MKQLTKKDWVNRIDEIVKCYKRLSEICESAGKLGMMDINGALHETIWDAFQCMMRMLDCDGWIEWYIYENECGGNKYTAGYDGNVKPIETSEDLAELIIESIERDAK